MRQSALQDCAEFGSDWSNRCQHWIAESEPKVCRRRRERETNPLVLTGHGLSMRVDKGCLLIRDGFTHYPADRREWRFFNGELSIPPSIILIDGSGEISLGAIDWLATQGVSLIRLRWNGEFAAVVTTGGHAASPEKILWQQETRDIPARRVAFGLELLKQKARNTLVTMEQHVPRSKAWNGAYRNIATRVRWLDERPPKQFRKLLGLEGAIANEYFRSWAGMELKWRVSKRHPIPDDWKTFKSRAALRDGRRRAYRATHPINAMLNYAYGVLTAQTQIRLISEGYNPMLGIMHDEEDARGTYPALALDHMEPMRPVVDRAILHLIDTTTFTGADFSIQHDGVCRLNPELARRVAHLALRHYADASQTDFLKPNN